MDQWLPFILMFVGVCLLFILVEDPWAAVDWIMGAFYTIDGWLPYKCNCGHWIAHKKDRLWLEMTTGTFAFLCKECYEKEVK